VKSIPRTGKRRQAQDGGEGQKISLREVPKTQPQARKDSGPVILPTVPGRERGGIPVRVLYLHGWNSVVGGVRPTYLNPYGYKVVESAASPVQWNVPTTCSSVTFSPRDITTLPPPRPRSKSLSDCGRDRRGAPAPRNFDVRIPDAQIHQQRRTASPGALP
jgi:hypothetical protein